VRLAGLVWILLIAFESEILKGNGTAYYYCYWAFMTASLVLDVEQMNLSTTALKDNQEVQKWKEIHFS